MTGPLEITAALLLLANVWLVARRSMWNYAFGIAAVSLYAFIFWQSRLYSVAGLQLLFIGLNLYGLANWRRARTETGGLPVSRLGGRMVLATGLGVLVATAAIALLLATTTDAASPLADSLTSALSLSAQYWQARRRAEAWVLWILADLVSEWLYATEGLWVTVLVYAVLLGVAVYGWREWKRVAHGN